MRLKERLCFFVFRRVESVWPASENKCVFRARGDRAPGGPAVQGAPEHERVVALVVAGVDAILGEGEQRAGGRLEHLAP